MALARLGGLLSRKIIPLFSPDRQPYSRAYILVQFTLVYKFYTVRLTKKDSQIEFLMYCLSVRTQFVM